MRLSCFVITVVVSSTLGAVCNLTDCHQILTQSLHTGFDIDTAAKFRVIAFTGTAITKCSVTLTAENSLNMFAETIWTISSPDIIISSEFNENPNLYQEIEITPTRTIRMGLNNILDHGVQFAPDNDTFLKMLSPQYETKTAAINYQNSDRIKSNHPYIEKLVNGIPIKEGGSVTRTLKSEGCGDDLTVSLCPCSEPVISSLQHHETMLTCSAVSIDGVKISWEKDGNQIKNETKSVELIATSILHNITSTNHSMNYTCIATSGKNSSYRAVRSITIPANNYNPDDEEVTDGGDSLLTYIISIVVVGVVVTVGLCVGFVKLLQHCAHSKERRLRNDAVEQNVDISSEIDLQPLRLDDEPQDVTTSGAIPTYTEVSLRDRAPSEPEMESVYNRLDPKMMTTCREGWRTYRPGEGIVPSTLAAASHTMRVILQPPACNPPPVPGFEQNNFSPTGTEGHYEMQSLRL